MPPQARSPIVRFMEKVIKRDDGCWEFSGFVDKVTGYAHFYDGISVVGAHRFAYKALIGPIVPESLHLDHVVCKNRWCVNPWHTEPVTLMENLLRGDRSHLGHLREKTHCPSGHPYDKPNTYVNKVGARMCRSCNREKMRARRATSAKLAAE